MFYYNSRTIAFPFEKLHLDAKDNNRKTKVLLVSMDFVERMDLGGSTPASRFRYRGLGR